MGHLVKNHRGSRVVTAEPDHSKPSDKILLVLQYWRGDREQAGKLTRFITDLCPERSAQADFLFSARYDCPIDHEAAKYASRKFDVWTHQCRRRGVGWPNGCNELWMGTMGWLGQMMNAGKVPRYKAVFTFESDCVPLRRDWLTHFRQHWDKANQTRPTYVMGALLKAPGEHINGNALFSTRPEFMNWIYRDIVSASSCAGWDYWMAPEFKQWGWAVMPGLYSYWNSRTLPDEEIARLFDSGAVFLHGVKDDSLLDAARERLLI